MKTHEEILAIKKSRIHQLHRFDLRRTALIVVDMQRGFLDPQASLCVPPGRDLIPPLRGLIDVCRTHQVPVFYTAFLASPLVPTLRGDPFGPEHLPPQAGQPTGWGHPSGNCQYGMQGPESPEITPELMPRPDEMVIQGYSLDKFYGTPLDHVLRARDIRYLIFTGIMADLCVASTLFSAATREYRVTVLRDGIAT
ncbi:MAG: isochorismatase family cysteine hydrolase, partial [Verrucomicrobiae bacterium]|nr:isochorismatase family cysteine hydrolase [Verrucomicrobiae bacterium]